ncbi:MAG TPA: hypothetical protein VIK18_06725 [Pirellulales bacterium]
MSATLAHCIHRTGRTVFAVAAGGLWLAVVLLGFYRITAYELRRSPAVGAPRMWPAESRLPHSPSHSTLLVFLHPRCPCSRATLDELGRVLHGHRDVQATAVFVRPDGLPEAWEQSELWHTASQIPGLEKRVDAGGEEARRFDVTASGQTLIYGPDGRLAFEGGLTATRGHYGRNSASDAALDVLKAAPASPLEFPTYGCPLLDEPQSCCKVKKP